MIAKEYYRSYHANNDLFEIDKILVKQVLKLTPDSVLDFGCGTGKNIAPIRDKGIDVVGLDVSLLNINQAKLQHHLPHLIIGDEETLRYLRGFSLILTCSVLCHIEDITNIIEEFKRLTRYIIIAETNDIVGEYYYAHDYESYGFVDMDMDWYSNGNSANYKFYKYERM